MEKLRFHNMSRILRYAVGGFSLSTLYLLARKGPRKAATLIVRTGRMKDRVSGCGLPLITVKELLRKLRGDQTFDCNFHPYHYGNISGDPNHTLPWYLIAIIAAAVRPLNALEIGTGHGGTTCQIAAQLRQCGTVVTVDVPLEWSNPIVRPDSQEITEEQYIISSISAQKKFAWQGTSLESRIQLIREDSRTLDYFSIGRKFDFVFIDGSHTENAVRRDTESVLPFLNEGAVILWHDYQSSKLSHGVDKYLHKLSDSIKWPIYVIEYSTLAIQIRR